MITMSRVTDIARYMSKIIYGTEDAIFKVTADFTISTFDDNLDKKIEPSTFRWIYKNGKLIGGASDLLVSSETSIFFDEATRTLVIG